MSKSFLKINCSFKVNKDLGLSAKPKLKQGMKNTLTQHPYNLDSISAPNQL
jgi:hypothetical protein